MVRQLRGPVAAGVAVGLAAVAAWGLVVQMRVAVEQARVDGPPAAPLSSGWRQSDARPELLSAEALLSSVDPDPLVAAVLLEPDPAPSLRACPGVEPALRPLCDGAALVAARARADVALAAALGSMDEHTALWAVEAAVELGPRGEALARSALDGTVSGARPHHQQALAAEVLARTTHGAARTQALRQLLLRDDAAALVAALELERLGDSESADAIEALARRWEGTAQGVTATWAARSRR